MAKVALLIGVSHYQAGFSPLPKARQDVEAMQQALQDHSIEGFDPIQVLLDPDVQTMRVKIESLFSGRSKDDLLVLFFSGHGIKDDRGKLYFASQDTRKSTSGELIRATAVAASFVQELMSQSRCKRQVVILDCCFSGAFAAGMEAKDSGIVDIETQLGGEGRAVLTSSTSTQYSFEEQSADLSIYTRYLVEGLETGAADLDHDGWIEVDELHDYAKGKVQATAPAMKPEIYAVKEGYKIRLTRARIGDPKLRYRQEAESYANRGEISGVGRIILNTLRDQLGVSAEEAAQIEDELLRPYRERWENLQRYREAMLTAVELGYPFSEQTRNDLNHFQDILGLREEDVAPIEAEVTASALQTAKPTPSSPTASPQPQSRQAGILSSKKVRRSVLLATTALGLVLIIYSIGKGVAGNLPFFLGVSLILLGGIYACIWRARTQGIAFWRRVVLFVGGMAAGLAICLLAWNRSIPFFVLGIIICFISIYIGGW